jgi:hypothetical protein
VFLSKYESQLNSFQCDYDFDEEFDRLALHAETKHMQEKKMKNRGVINTNKNY